MGSRDRLFVRGALGLTLALSLAACTTSGGQAASAPGSDVVSGGGGGGAAGGMASRFFLPTGEPDNTSAPSIEVDRMGGIHAVYPAYAGGNAYYAYCKSDCSAPEQVSVVHFATDATVANAMLALDANGRPQVLLSTAREVYFASPGPEGDFTNQASWKQSKILDHGGTKEVTGEAFALDPQGHPRFLAHTYVAYLGVGQKAPETHYVACDGRCDDPASWRSSRIATEIWQSSSLRFDAQGRAKVASVVRTGMSDSSSGQDTGAYLECAADCGEEASWKGIGFGYAYSSSLAAVTIKPAISLALTKTGAPRVLLLGGEGPTSSNHHIAYFECDSDCTNDHWTATKVSDHAGIEAGIDLALDAQDHPRFVYTLDFNIGLVSCDSSSCTGESAKWDVVKVEAGSDLKPDEIFLYSNCTVAAWFLHSPSIALAPDGKARVGYQARDISGGTKNPDPTKPRCVAGTDLTWSRLAVL